MTVTVTVMIMVTMMVMMMVMMIVMMMVVMMVTVTVTAMTMIMLMMEVVDVSLMLLKVLPHQFRSILLETRDQVRTMNKILQTSGDRLKSLLLATSCCKVDPRTVNPL